MSSNRPKSELYNIPGGVLSISHLALQNLLQAVLTRGVPFRFKAKGFSMYPFIRDGDVITVSPRSGRKTLPGDVIAFCHPETGKLVVHRVITLKPGGLLLQGDNTTTPEGLIPYDKVLGVLTKITRNGRRVRFGLGPERRLIAWLNCRGWLHIVTNWSGAFLKLLSRGSTT